jgi:hypothetical protein
VAYWRNHLGAARDLGRSLLLAAFETAVDAQSCPGFGKLVSTMTTVHPTFTAILASTVQYM